MSPIYEIALRLGTALGIGLLIGSERERRKGNGGSRAPGGIRTFATTCLIGAVSFQLGGEALLAVTTLAIAVLLSIAYIRARSEDPGLTTEASLLLTLLLGALAMRQPAVASGLAVVLAALLAARSQLHRFTRSVLTEAELADALILAAAVLVVFPLMPDQYLGPYRAINPRMIWRIVLLMISISALGYICVRMLGNRFGLPIAGLFSGFVSSAATIASMGSHAKETPTLLRPAVAGAVLSTVATIIQFAVVLISTSRQLAATLALPLLATGMVASMYSAFFTFRSIRHSTSEPTKLRSAFSLKTALVFALTFTAVLLATKALNSWMGRSGVLMACTLAGFADAHSAAFSAASLVSSGTLTVRDAVFPCIAGLTSNTITKAVLAIIVGGRPFAWQVVPGLLLVIATAWIGVSFLSL